MKHETTLMVIVAIALFLRLWNLDNWIKAFVDETTFMIPAYSKVDSIFSLTSWQHSGIFQLYAPAFALTTNPEIALLLERIFIGVLPGVCSVCIIYFLFKKFYNKNVGLIAASILAILPFHVLYSRIAIMYSFSLFLYLVIFYFFSVGLKSQNRIYIILSIIISLLAIQLSLPTMQFCILLVTIFGTLFVLKNRLKIKKDIKHKYRSKKILAIGISIIALLVFFTAIGTIPFFIKSTLNIPPAEKGFERMFGYTEAENAIFSLSHIANYSFILNTLPILCLAIIGLTFAFYKKDILVIAWLIALIPSFYYGYYPRRFIFESPLIALLSANVICLLWSQTNKIKLNFRMKKVTKILVIILIGATLCYSFTESFAYANDFAKSNAPQITKDIFVSRYTSGSGIQETLSYIKTISDKGVILTDTPNLIRYYLIDNNNYSVADLAQFQMTKTNLLAHSQNNSIPTFIIVRWINWINSYIYNITKTDPQIPIVFLNQVNVTESTIDNKISIYKLESVTNIGEGE